MDPSQVSEYSLAESFPPFHTMASSLVSENGFLGPSFLSDDFAIRESATTRSDPKTRALLHQVLCLVRRSSLSKASILVAMYLLQRPQLDFLLFQQRCLCVSRCIRVPCFSTERPSFSIE